MSDWTGIATLDELWEGDIAEVTVGSDVILLAHLPGGEVRAYQGVCPHAEYPLASGDLDGAVLTCAGHLWEFDLSTGEGVNPSNCQLYEYPVRLSGDQICVSIPQDGKPHHNRCRTQGEGATHMSTGQQHLVGPVVRGFDPDIVDGLTAAIEKDNPGVRLLIDDNAGYVRIHAPRVLRVTRASLSEALGRPIDLPSLEPAIASFAGRMRYDGDDTLIWYLTREDS